MKSHIQTLISDSWRGGILKSLALAARVVFLLLVVPGLPAGELTAYVFANSVAILGATLLILGLNEELPRIIGGDLLKARGYLRWYATLSGIAGIALLVAAFSSRDLSFLPAALFVLALLSGRLLGGIVRSIDAGLNEQLQNFPWLLFIVVVLVTDIDRAYDLIVAMSACLLLVQWTICLTVFRHVSVATEFQHASLMALIRVGLQHGITRLLANFLLLALMRSPVLVPVWFGLGGDLDQIAFALAIGEMVAQFGAIPVNRAYTRWCQKPPSRLYEWKSCLITSFMLIAGLFILAAAGLMLAWWFGLLPSQASNIAVQLQALLLFAVVQGFRMNRYLVWSCGILGGWTVMLSLTMVLLSWGAIFSLSANWWFVVMSAVVLGGIFALAARSKNYFKG